jgi:dimeric dUTPase (all-alpha-NTP-PPase superfamily)
MSYISVAITTSIVIALSCCFMYRKQKKKEDKHKYRESLKNALLSIPFYYNYVMDDESQTELREQFVLLLSEPRIIDLIKERHNLR